MSSHGEDFEYCGDCCVCGEPVELSDMGVCGKCDSVFHWGSCGEWGVSEHVCNSCKDEKEDDK